MFWWLLLYQGFINLNRNGNSANFSSYVCNGKRFKSYFPQLLDFGLNRPFHPLARHITFTSRHSTHSSNHLGWASVLLFWLTWTDTLRSGEAIPISADDGTVRSLASGPDSHSTLPPSSKWSCGTWQQSVRRGSISPPVKTQPRGLGLAPTRATESLPRGSPVWHRRDG